jgi:hypothetical protein
VHIIAVYHSNHGQGLRDLGALSILSDYRLPQQLRRAGVLLPGAALAAKLAAGAELAEGGAPAGWCRSSAAG